MRAFRVDAAAAAILTIDECGNCSKMSHHVHGISTADEIFGVGRSHIELKSSVKYSKLKSPSVIVQNSQDQHYQYLSRCS
jgi:hypothetical protein